MGLVLCERQKECVKYHNFSECLEFSIQSDWCCTIHVMLSADNLRQDLVTSGLLEHLRWMSGEHSNQGVKDAATSTLAVLEEELNRYFVRLFKMNMIFECIIVSK